MMDRFLFGKEYTTDERVKAAVDRAGNLTAMVLFAINFCGMLASLILRRDELGVVSTIAVLTGGAFYLFQMVRNGAIAGEKSVFPKGKWNSILIIFLVSPIYGAGYILYRRFFHPDSFARHSWLQHATAALVASLIFGVGFFLLMKILGRLGEKRLEKMERRENQP